MNGVLWYLLPLYKRYTVGVWELIDTRPSLWYSLWRSQFSRIPLRNTLIWIFRGKMFSYIDVVPSLIFKTNLNSLIHEKPFIFLQYITRQEYYLWHDLSTWVHTQVFPWRIELQHWCHSVPSISIIWIGWNKTFKRTKLFSFPIVYLCYVWRCGDRSWY